ncbi:YybH family protein [Alsobacter sp. SYSU BS001988]
MSFRAMVAAVALIAPLAANAQDKAETQALNEKFVAAVNDGDFALAAKMYQPEAMIPPPGGQMLQGYKAIQAFWKGMGDFGSDLWLTSQDVQTLGATSAREIGTFRFKSKGPQPQTVEGKYLAIWVKSGDLWLINTDMWNTNNELSQPSD